MRVLVAREATNVILGAWGCRAHEIATARSRVSLGPRKMGKREDTTKGFG